MARGGGSTELTEYVRAALVKATTDGGWSYPRIAREMNMRGHSNWGSNNVRAACKDRVFTLDEGVAMLGILRGNATAVIRAVDDVTEEIARMARKEKP